MDLVSIVVPVYNGEKYVWDCAEYIKAQTYRNLEVIFVNDGSSDRSFKVCEEIAKEDSRFRVIDKENEGTAHTRNAGLDVASGEYISFLDVDDAYDPEMIEKMLRLIQTTETDMAVCGYRFRVEKDKGGIDYVEEKKWPSAVYRSIDEIKEDYISIWDADMFCNVWNKMYRMETIRKYGMRFKDGEVYDEDCVFNRLFLSKSQSVAFTDECLYDYIRERAGSTTEKYREDFFDIRDNEYNEFEAHFKEMGLWDEKTREYNSRRFIERIAGCIENVFHAEKQLTIHQKYNRIKELIGHEDVREAVKYAKCRSLAMKAFATPIRWNWTPGAYAMGLAIYLVRKNNPAMFHQLKGKR